MEDPENPSTPPPNQRFQCPGCEEEIDVPADALGQLVRCPYCNTQFFADEKSAGQEIVDDTEPMEEAVEEKHELDSIRIQQLTALRRGAIRVRSWCLIAAVVCLVGAVQLVIKSVQNVRHEHHWGLRPTGFILFAIGGVILSAFFFKRARELKREIDKPALEDPVEPPDFSKLGDGSQRWKNLEDVR